MWHRGDDDREHEQHLQLHADVQHTRDTSVRGQRGFVFSLAGPSIILQFKPNPTRNITPDQSSRAARWCRCSSHAL